MPPATSAPDGQYRKRLQDPPHSYDVISAFLYCCWPRYTPPTSCSAAFALPRPDALSPLSLWRPLRAHNTRQYEHSSSGASGPIGVGHSLN
jgi:hypothetical protein